MKFPTKENFSMFVGSVTINGLQSRSGLFGIYQFEVAINMERYLFQACKAPGMFLYNFEVKA